ncbi:MAG TPA: cupin fold metalloprotein, WbuC family [Betaproteobacteria bacterium]|nr:cupin fold metalloprotein, WbuC family [Betaproteobacteria bacterium]
MTNPCWIDRSLLDEISRAAVDSARRRRNHNFHSHDDAICHRLLNAVEPDSYIPPHRHLDASKDEAMIILRGRLGVVFFDVEGNIASTAVLQPGGETVAVNIPHGVFHSVLGLEEGVVFFEAKAGPYRPLSAEEKAPWAPAEDAPDAAAYYRRLRRLFA